MKIVPIIQTLPQKVSYVRKPQRIALNSMGITCAFDKLIIRAKNNIVMKQDVGKCHYSFFEGDKNIGYAVFEESFITKAREGDKPLDWYISCDRKTNDDSYNLKPSIYVDEFVIEDRIGLTGDYSQRKSGKKYGTMCLQKILEWAKEHGYGSRISLTPGKTHSDIAPHKFYAKIGFEMSPNDIKNVEKWEEKYSTEPIYYKRKRYEKVDDRWVSRGQELYLTHPEILENYPLD